MALPERSSSSEAEGCRLTVGACGITVPDMSVAARNRLGRREVPAWQTFLLFVIGAFFAWGSGGSDLSQKPARETEVCQADDFAHTRPVQVTSEEAADQDELETLSEQVEDPLLALRQPDFGLEASLDGDDGEHGSSVGWAVRSSVTPSSTARGPPLA